MPWTAFRFAVRRLFHAPLFTAVTLVTLAVGIGANTAIFSIVNGVLLKPLPIHDPSRLHDGLLLTLSSLVSSLRC